MEFVAKVDPVTGEFVFASKLMEMNYKQIKSFYGNTGSYFRFALLDDIRPSNTNQHNLYKRLCMMVANTSGQTFKEISDEFHRQFAPTEDVEGLFGKTAIRRKEYTEFDMREYSDYLNNCILLANDMFDMGLELFHDDNIGTVLTQKKKQ